MLCSASPMADTPKTAESITGGDTATSSPPPASSPISTKVPTSNSSLLPPSMARLWRPAAQRNLRNQWSKLGDCRQRWKSSSSSGRSHATSLVNAFLSQRYMPSMELGVLKDLPDIQKKACQKLFKQQELHRSKLLSSYRNMVSVVLDMVNAMGSMRCYLKGSNSPLVQFSGSSNEKDDDTGDGGGVPVYTFWSIAFFEKLANELVEMFESELNLKRLLVLELLSARCREPQFADTLDWSHELYQGEFSNLALCSLYSEVDGEVLLPKLKGCELSDACSAKCGLEPSHETLQLYLTAWLVEVNVDSHRVQEIFAIVGEEMNINLQ